MQQACRVCLLPYRRVQWYCFAYQQVRCLLLLAVKFSRSGFGYKFNPSIAHHVPMQVAGTS